RGFALAELDVARREVDRRAAELAHADLERDARPEARLLEDHRARAAGEERVRPPRAELRLEAPREREDRVGLVAAEIPDAEAVALHAAASAFSRIASPSSTSGRSMTSGGRGRSKPRSGQWMSRPSRRQRSTTPAPGRSSTAPSMRPSPRTCVIVGWR